MATIRKVTQGTSQSQLVQSTPKTIDEVLKKLIAVSQTNTQRILTDLADPQFQDKLRSSFEWKVTPPVDGQFAKIFATELARQQLKSAGTPTPATTEIVAKFLDSKRGAVSEGSLVSYRGTLNAFAKYCPVLPTLPEELESYFARFKERRSAASAYAVIRLLYEFAHDRCNLPNVIEHVKRPRFKQKQPARFTLDEARKIVEACRSDREVGFIHLYMGHGLRLEEGVRLNVGDIGEGKLMVKGKERTEFMPLLPETREILLRLANGQSPEAPIFTGQDGRLSHKQAYNVVKAILD